MNASLVVRWYRRPIRSAVRAPAEQREPEPRVVVEVDPLEIVRSGIREPLRDRRLETSAQVGDACTDALERNANELRQLGGRRLRERLLHEQQRLRRDTPPRRRVQRLHVVVQRAEVAIHLHRAVVGGVERTLLPEVVEARGSVERRVQIPPERVTGALHENIGVPRHARAGAWGQAPAGGQRLSRHGRIHLRGRRRGAREEHRREPQRRADGIPGHHNSHG